MKRLLKEPLLHFLLIGAALFLLSSLTADDEGLTPTDDRIVVSEGRIEQLANIFAKTWQRPPTRKELEGLIDDFVLEEVYYRQAVAMGLDRDDTVIRRRMRQKLEFLTDDIATPVPEEEDLLAYLEEKPDKFRRDSTYTFRQIYLNPERHEDLEEAAKKKLGQLKAGEDVAGDSDLLPADFRDASTRLVNGSFGRGFAARLDELPTGEWSGPVPSGLGAHLVKVDARAPGIVPPLAEIRGPVEREWINEKRTALRTQFNAELKGNYEIVVEWPTETRTP